MKRIVMDRRTLLRGAGGVLLGLPMLEAMLPRVARAAPSPLPKRIIVSYAGTTHGPSRAMNPPVGALPATLPAPCAALTPVRQLVTMVSGLAVPRWTGTTPVPGAAYQQQHGMVMAPMLAGMHSNETMPVMPGGHTVDQVVADAFGKTTRLASVQACIQAAGYGGGGSKGIQSARLENGRVRALAPIASPALLFSTLFGGAPIPTAGSTSGPTVATRKDKSILDFVLADAKRLEGSVGARDRVRLEQHFTELRELEKRLSTVPAVSASCTSPGAAPTDPAVVGPGTFGSWSNETLRGDLLADMIGLALACDLTRAVSLMISYDQSFLRTQDPLATYADMHATGHSGTATQIADNANWHVGRFAKVVKRLSEIPEGAGTVLDSTFVAMVFAEGNNSHNTQDMTAFVAGVPSALRMGQHIASGGAHPAQLMIAGMKALGLPGSTLGEVSGPFSPLLL